MTNQLLSLTYSIKQNQNIKTHQKTTQFSQTCKNQAQIRRHEHESFS